MTPRSSTRSSLRSLPPFVSRSTTPVCASVFRLSYGSCGWHGAGVQQQLLALGAELRAGARLARNLGHAAASSLEAAVAETTILLDEVRELAHGVYPAILTDAGLAPAVASLADVAQLPVKLTGAPTGRYPSSVEATAYRVVAEGVENAVRHSDATIVRVGVCEAGDAVVVDVHDDGQGGAAVTSVGGLA